MKCGPTLPQVKIAVKKLVLANFCGHVTVIERHPRTTPATLMAELEGASCVVTGASSGIGRAAALLFAENGANVLCVDMNSVDDTVAMITGGGAGRAVGMTADVSDEVRGRGWSEEGGG